MGERLDMGNPKKLRCTTCKYLGRTVGSDGDKVACRLLPEPTHLINRIEHHWCHQHEGIVDA